MTTERKRLGMAVLGVLLCALAIGLGLEMAGTGSIVQAQQDIWTTDAARKIGGHYRPIIRAVPWPSALCSGRCAL